MKKLNKVSKAEIFTCIHLLGYIAQYLDLFYENVELYRDGKNGICDMDYLTDKIDVMKRLLDNFGHERFWDVASHLSEKDVRAYFTPDEVTGDH